ncbi:hypothetical protein QBC35DRAFT_528221 [Podospora australis]|uniref:Stress-response A/B barrel domain-containing protein n=1 Tax=Podospora australis TaxID=1536484 RepID=A0AAN7AMH2_9PEZI|nr:hypothetical protein QBC35DRAFT_528221 [Podospora australis]
MGSRGTQINRMTMFKIPDPENQQKMVEEYKKLAKNQNKNGKPYVPYTSAGVTNNNDERNKGYTVVAYMRFASLEDMEYYDDECAAHAALKKAGGSLGVAEPPLVVYFEGEGQGSQ